MGFIKELCNAGELPLHNGTMGVVFRDAVQGALKWPMGACDNCIREVTESFPDDEKIQWYALKKA